ncbi:hypothetical protein J433_09942 [Corynebacterium glutamicum MT]|uniref:Uncharacterized protein n=1 Tax=Corynebacterium glutamicum TaxID=1718 RepID=A0AB36I503_CORGT|nr:hypothetical protein [Corynebacterium glutamicum]AGN18133.1 hypothetical protein C624_02720 [Corynebacterium glutamicum SCgG1]AGN21156.1 hypothetical protein C629_02720 [Corynebacterium glutamicum SCgG2]EGV41061.1 hypothetical protein CgS9114_05557 [Corynebacterium glutamicum S9114]EOA64134.1 hypothetical protein J433_09942 [Corynebacterium glutamicum MT]EPP41875.1 hypothetical protein A583_02256 [Corynebacterium glutamicum Z188]
MKARAYARELQRDGLSVDEKELKRKFHSLARINASQQTEGDAVGITFPAERALRWLIDQPKYQASSLPEEVVPVKEQYFVYRELLNLSLAQETHDIDKNFSFWLTDRGAVEANRLRNSYRYSVAQRKVLDWCRSHPNSSPEEILQTSQAQDFSGILTQAEVVQAANELNDKGYIDMREASGGFILFARLTSDGEQLYRQNMSIDQVNSPRGASTMNISANNYGQQTIGNQTLGGQGHTVTAHLSIDQSSADINHLLEAVREVIEKSDAPTEEKQDFVNEVADIEKRKSKRGREWALRSLELLVNSALPILGAESASALMELIPKN